MANKFITPAEFAKDMIEQCKKLPLSKTEQAQVLGLLLRRFGMGLKDTKSQEEK